MKKEEFIEPYERMKTNEFIEEFKNLLDVYNNYFDILDDLNNRKFPFHDMEKHIVHRKYYYWLKQHSNFKFRNLNRRLKELVNIKVDQSFDDN